MRKISFSTDVHAARETVWKLLVDKMENPGEYMPGVVETKVLERHDDWLVREVRTQGMVITEKISTDEPNGEIRYLLVDHPLFSGWVINRVVSASVQSPVAPQIVTIEVDWTPKDDAAEEIARTDLSAQIQQEVLSLKQKAEELEKKA